MSISKKHNINPGYLFLFPGEKWERQSDHYHHSSDDSDDAGDSSFNEEGDIHSKPHQTKRFNSLKHSQPALSQLPTDVSPNPHNPITQPPNPHSTDLPKMVRHFPPATVFNNASPPDAFFCLPTPTTPGNLQQSRSPICGEP